jgi:hypothetical protein
VSAVVSLFANVATFITRSPMPQREKTAILAPHGAKKQFNQGKFVFHQTGNHSSNVAIRKTANKSICY